MIQQKLTKEELYEFIVDFSERYGQVPLSGFLAGYFKVTIGTINAKLDILQNDGLIKKIKAKERKTGYKLIRK